MKTPHKHAALIKAWADGAAIQVKDERLGWCDIWRTPTWNPEYQYRIKPEPKPDVVRYVSLNEHGSIMTGDAIRKNSIYCSSIKCVFDGETGKLKSVEII